MTEKIRSSTSFFLQRLLLNVFKEFSIGSLVKFILKMYEAFFFYFEKSKIWILYSRMFSWRKFDLLKKEKNAEADLELPQHLKRSLCDIN